jgi:lipopolysaccharide transport system permease protein
MVLRQIIKEANPVLIIREIWMKRDLIGQFARRDIQGRYSGSYLGIIWSLIIPLVMLMIYTFVFGVIFKARWRGVGGVSSDLASFSLAMFAGSLTFTIFSDSVNRAPGLIVSVPNFVKKVVFPLEILPIAALLGAIFQAALAIIVLAVAQIWILHDIHWSIFLTPIALLPIAMFSLGMSWILSSLGVFIRDIGPSVIILTQILFFLSPIFYPVDSIPPEFRPWMRMNPLTPMIEVSRSALLGLSPFQWGALFQSLVISLVVFCLGRAWFQLTRSGFADVI